jgi:hypothetical protein
VTGREFTRTINRRRRQAERDELQALEGMYARLLGDVADEAVGQFQTLTAAADWQPPPEGFLVSLATLASVASARFRAIHERVLEAVAAPPLARVGIAWDVTHPLSRELLAKAGRRAGQALGEAVQPVLRETVAQAYAEGLSVPGTATRIRSAIRDASGWQSEMLARTDLNSLANGASSMAARLAGIAYKTWLATLDDRTRPEHAAAHGQSVPVDQTFTVGGEDLDYPGDPDGSDENTINCRCSLAYGDTLEEAGLIAASGGIIPDTLATSEITAAVAAPVRWQAVLAVEGEPTEDGRLLSPGALTWRELPLPLMALLDTSQGHDGAHVAGRIDRIWRDDNQIMGAGEFDIAEFAAEVTRLVEDETLRGVSVDLAIREFEVILLDEDGNEINEAEVDPIEALVGDVQSLFVIKDAVIGAATIVPFQAIANATITITSSANDQAVIARPTEWKIGDAALEPIDRRINSALDALANVAALAAANDQLERDNDELRRQIIDLREDSDRRLLEATVSQKQEFLAHVEALTARVLEQRAKPRQVRVIRGDDGRPVAYEEASVE